MSKKTPINIRPGPKTEEDVTQDIQGQSTLALTNLLEKMGTAPWEDMGEYMEEVNKSKRENWNSMRDSTKELITFGAFGGFNQLFGGSVSRFKDQLSNSLDGALAPILNAISPLTAEVAEVLEPLASMVAEILKPIVAALKELFQWLYDMVMYIKENAKMFSGAVGGTMQDVVDWINEQYWSQHGGERTPDQFEWEVW